MWIALHVDQELCLYDCSFFLPALCLVYKPGEISVQSNKPVYFLGCKPHFPTSQLIESRSIWVKKKHVEHTQRRCNSTVHSSGTETNWKGEKDGSTNEKVSRQFRNDGLCDFPASRQSYLFPINPEVQSVRFCYFFSRVQSSWIINLAVLQSPTLSQHLLQVACDTSVLQTAPGPSALCNSPAVSPFRREWVTPCTCSLSPARNKQDLVGGQYVAESTQLITILM